MGGGGIYPNIIRVDRENLTRGTSTMELMLNGNLEMGVHVESELGYLIC